MIGLSAYSGVYNAMLLGQIKDPTWADKALTATLSGGLYTLPLGPGPAGAAMLIAGGQSLASSLGEELIPENTPAAIASRAGFRRHHQC